MKKLLLIFALLLTATSAFTQPYILSTDPQPDVSVYRMRLSSDNGVTWSEWAEGPPINQVLKFDIRNVAKGYYKGEAQAGGTDTLTDSLTGGVTSVTTWSESAKFTLDRKPGKAPTTLRLER